MNKNIKHIKTTIKEFLNENQNGFTETVYRGIGKRINYTYNGTDDGMGIFWTDNLTMAKWFAGLIEYNGDTDKYEEISTDGKIISKKLNLKNPYIINSDDEDYDSFQQYMNDIKDSGGVDNYKNNLLNNNYDGIILKNNNTNYYEDGVYDIYIEF